MAWAFMCFVASVFRGLHERRLVAPGVPPVAALSLFQAKLDLLGLLRASRPLLSETHEGACGALTPTSFRGSH